MRFQKSWLLGESYDSTHFLSSAYTCVLLLSRSDNEFTNQFAQSETEQNLETGYICYQYNSTQLVT